MRASPFITVKRSESMKATFPPGNVWLTDASPGATSGVALPAGSVSRTSKESRDEYQISISLGVRSGPGGVGPPGNGIGPPTRQCSVRVVPWASWPAACVRHTCSLPPATTNARPGCSSRRSTARSTMLSASWLPPFCPRLMLMTQGIPSSRAFSKM
jgi:hypothetical protein